MRSDADRAELQLAQLRGEMVPTADVERVWSQKIAELFGLFDKHHARGAPKLSGLDAPAILKALKETIRKVREESAT